MLQVSKLQQMVVICQLKLNSLDLKQPIKPQITAVNNQSYSSILLLKQLKVLAYSLKKYQSARNPIAIKLNLMQTIINIQIFTNFSQLRKAKF